MGRGTSIPSRQAIGFEFKHYQDDEIDVVLESSYFRDAMQQCRIGLTENGELVIVPGAGKVGDVICALSGAVSACVLRPLSDGSWVLISGDCHISTQSFRSTGEFENSFFMCDEYVMCNRDRVEEFKLR